MSSKIQGRILNPTYNDYLSARLGLTLKFRVNRNGERLLTSEHITECLDIISLFFQAIHRIARTMQGHYFCRLALAWSAIKETIKESVKVGVQRTCLASLDPKLVLKLIKQEQAQDRAEFEKYMKVKKLRQHDKLYRHKAWKASLWA